MVGGPIRQHPFLQRLIHQYLPEIDVLPIDDLVATGDSWRPAAAALLGLFQLDQLPANSTALTGCETPRILGRISPGAPANWHQVLADLAETLPDKVTLRNAV